MLGGEQAVNVKPAPRARYFPHHRKRWRPHRNILDNKGSNGNQVRTTADTDGNRNYDSTKIVNSG